jgi:hypothetical protein
MEKGILDFYHVKTEINRTAETFAMLRTMDEVKPQEYLKEQN